MAIKSTIFKAQLSIADDGIGFDPERPREGGMGLRGMALVLHCAGPFSQTALPMVRGCLEAGAHYLDITGEISVFEHAQAQRARRQRAKRVRVHVIGMGMGDQHQIGARQVVGRTRRRHQSRR